MNAYVKYKLSIGSRIAHNSCVTGKATGFGEAASVESKGCCSRRVELVGSSMESSFGDYLARCNYCYRRSCWSGFAADDDLADGDTGPKEN